MATKKSRTARRVQEVELSSVILDALEEFGLANSVVETAIAALEHISVDGTRDIAKTLRRHCSDVIFTQKTILEKALPTARLSGSKLVVDVEVRHG